MYLSDYYTCLHTCFKFRTSICTVTFSNTVEFELLINGSSCSEVPFRSSGILVMIYRLYTIFNDVSSLGPSFPPTPSISPELPLRRFPSPPLRTKSNLPPPLARNAHLIQSQTSGQTRALIAKIHPRTPTPTPPKKERLNSQQRRAWVGNRDAQREPYWSAL